MAKQNSAPDPVSAAMSAIESALNLTDDDNFVDSPSSPAPNAAAKPVIVTPVLKPAAPPAESAPLLRPSSAPLASLNESDAKPPLSATPPANDDRETVGAILQAMNARPASRTPFILALIGSVLWAALCGLYGYQNLWPTVSSGPLREALLRPETPLLALATLGPIFFMFGFAALSRRLRELRQSARAISQVAVRLAEPESSAGEHVATLSQAIRRELASMGDGVERALARAAELETRVKSEVTTLERSYSDSERRIRSLIAEMADQREAIVAGGSRVRDAIADAHGKRGPGSGFGRIPPERAPDRGRTAPGRLARRLGRGDFGGHGPHRFSDGRAHHRRGNANRGFDRRGRRQHRRAPRRDQPKNGRRHPGSGRRDR